MIVKIVQCWSNAWPVDAFHESVEEAVRLVLVEEPAGVAAEIRELILREWLAFSYPAGTA